MDALLVHDHHPKVGQVEHQIVDALLVHDHHPKVGQVEHQPLLNLFYTLNHQGVRLLFCHVCSVVPVHDGGGEEATIPMASILCLDHGRQVVHEVELGLASLSVVASNEWIDHVRCSGPEIVCKVPPGEVGCCRRAQFIPIPHLVESNVLGDVLGKLGGVAGLSRYRHYQSV